MSLPETNKSLGQHWLTDQATLHAICAAGEIEEGDTVLEIGPGPGALTELLVEEADRVVAVEFDSRLAEQLPVRVPADNLVVVQSDIMRFDLTTLPANYKVIANIPYYLTSNLIRLLSESSNPAERAILLIQKEVAERVAAKPGDMSLLSITAQYYWEASLGVVVPAQYFAPAPKVDSQVLILKRRTEALFNDVDEKLFFRVVKAGFAARRKTLLNSLSGGLRVEKTVVNTILQDAEIDQNIRPQNLSLEQWYKLYQAVNTRGLL